jgi:hypothetical protein
MRGYLITILMTISTLSFAQKKVGRCSYAQLKSFLEKGGGIDLDKPKLNQGEQRSQSQELVIPVVFHIVLNQDQIDELGGRTEIAKRVYSQLEAINKDFTAENDISIVTGGFADLIGVANIQFALAKRDAYGIATQGFQIQQTRQEGFAFKGTQGSGVAFSDAKYFMSDGDQSWDATSYLNIWVINMLSDPNEEQVLGLTVPPYFANNVTGIPAVEQGIVINYKAFGVQKASEEAYFSNATKGHTLTHELGHYFGLKHIWGDDDGECADAGGEDDGIGDTPPQADANYYCVEYPYYDDCSFEGDGIMFMNFMDYSPDDCLAMFTQEQVLSMRNDLMPGGASYSLTQHPDLLDPPVDKVDDYAFIISPNPASDNINVYFNQTPSTLKSITIFDDLGRIVVTTNDFRKYGYYSFPTSALTDGTYIVRVVFDDVVKCATAIVHK